MHHLTDRIAHTTTYGTLIVGHWLEREIAQSGPLIGVNRGMMKHHASDFNQTRWYSGYVIGNGLVGTRFTSQYRLQPRAGF